MNFTVCKLYLKFKKEKYSNKVSNQDFISRQVGHQTVKSLIFFKPREFWTHEPFLRNWIMDKIHLTKGWLGTFPQKDGSWVFNIFNFRAKTEIKVV